MLISLKPGKIKINWNKKLTTTYPSCNVCHHMTSAWDCAELQRILSNCFLWLYVKADKAVWFEEKWQRCFFLQRKWPEKAKEVLKILFMKSKTCISKKPKCITQYCEDFLGIVWDCVGLIKLCVFTPTHPVWSPVIIWLVVMTKT